MARSRHVFRAGVAYPPTGVLGASTTDAKAIVRLSFNKAFWPSTAGATGFLSLGGSMPLGKAPLASHVEWTTRGTG